ncbi:ead/Ea22-like family protein, partial [Escherichia coli]|uniref:ead/Ea22-like family protein n=1 Tax=Escherichia coli TaxID=562 RepID=UPI00117A724E
MSEIDKQALRESAANAKIAGEEPVMPFDQRITALNDFLKHCTPDTVLALLDERESQNKRIAELEKSEEQLINERD